MLSGLSCLGFIVPAFYRSDASALCSLLHQGGREIFTRTNNVPHLKKLIKFNYLIFFNETVPIRSFKTAVTSLELRSFLNTNILILKKHNYYQIKTNHRPRHSSSG
jgi:hypothetical protein